MGIKGLHKALSFCTVKDNLGHYRGRRVAVDASAWLHRSVYSVAEELAETPTDRVNEKCVRVSCMYMISRSLELLEGFGIETVFLVTDGERSPMKTDESQDRDRKHKQMLAEARQFKRSGQRYKAEERYKACIRIRDNFAVEVMSRVKREFKDGGKHAGRNVYIVEAPYEADAQLCKLMIDDVADAVITEDSDVLAYSAAAHVVFPILYKLDRGTGNCDRISMDWLLSPEITRLQEQSANDTNNQTTNRNQQSTSDMPSSSSIESILRRFASRQSARPGFGARLFVQACVLAGCDYSINKLDGVGLINAFKLVRDHAMRNDTVRFRKILESLPRKVKQSLNIDEYEETLSKSEAVFFYHYVRHEGGDVKPMLTPRLSVQENSADHHYMNHFPFMDRFRDDWSFLGVPRKRCDAIDIKLQLQVPSSSTTSMTRFTTGHTNFRAHTDKDQGRLNVGTTTTAATKKIIQNPYLKQTQRLQQQKSTKRLANNDQEENQPKRQCNDMMQYLERKKDTRLKRKNVGRTKPSARRSSFFPPPPQQQEQQQQQQVDRHESTTRIFDYSYGHDNNINGDDDSSLLSRKSRDDEDNGASDIFSEDFMFGFETYNSSATTEMPTPKDCNEQLVNGSILAKSRPKMMPDALERCRAKRETDSLESQYFSMSYPEVNQRTECEVIIDQGNCLSIRSIEDQKSVYDRLRRTKNEDVSLSTHLMDVESQDPLVTDESVDSSTPIGSATAHDFASDQSEDDFVHLCDDEVGTRDSSHEDVTSSHTPVENPSTTPSKEGVDLRRVTLSPRSQRGIALTKTFLDDTPSSPDDDIAEEIDSPEPLKNERLASSRQWEGINQVHGISVLSESKNQLKKKTANDGPLLSGFEKQRQFASRFTSALVSRKRRASQVTNLCQGRKKSTPQTKNNQSPFAQEKVQAALFKSWFISQPKPQRAQLTIDDGKSDEEWLWNG